MTTTLKHIKFDEEDLQAVRLAARLAARHARTEIALPSLSKHTTARKHRKVSWESSNYRRRLIRMKWIKPFMRRHSALMRDRMIAAAALKMSAPLITVDQQIIASGAVEVLE